MNRTGIIFLAAAMAAGFCSPAAAEDGAVREFFAMDTYMTILVNDGDREAAADAAEAEVQRLDGLLSTGNPDSEVSLLNEAGEGVLSEEGLYLLERGLELYRESAGLFDISVCPVMELWGFFDKNYRVPEAEELQDALSLVDASEISFDEETGKVTLGVPGMKIDFGGIAKGYTSGRLMELLRDYGCESALVNLGGNVEALGTKPDGSRWRVGVQDPDNSGGMIGVLEISDAAVITSGGYERYFEEDGVIYHHIIDPRTGFPADSGLVSVTIVSEDGALADGLSTFLYIAGMDEAVSCWRENADAFEMVLMTGDRELYVTEGLEDSFSSESDFEIITREQE